MTDQAVANQLQNGSLPPVLCSSTSTRQLLGSRRELLVESLEDDKESTGTRQTGSWLPSQKRLTSLGTFKRLEAAKEKISEQTPTPPSPASIRLKDGINLPVVGEVRWDLLKRYAVEWLRNPKNLALLVWIVAVAISGAILFMVMVGMLNAVLPDKRDRDTWFEVNNQILNALFTLMCVYVHPVRILHLWMLYRWQPADIIALRQVYCKNGTRKPHEWAHMMVVVLLLHLNCFSQYALCGLNWGYKRSHRPPIGVGICLASAIGFAAAAGIYNIVSPLGKDFAEEEVDETIEKLDACEKGREVPVSTSGKRVYWLLERKLSFASREGKLVENPKWQGGLSDFTDDPGSAFLSTICCFCVFGWNMDRLGFGNPYVHIVTFVLLCSAPFFVLNLAAVNIDNGDVRTSLGVGGIALSIFGLMYGGYWRIKMRQKFNLPAQRWCCNQPNMTDCTQWLFCSVCSLCQEVRTAEHYQVKDEKFYLNSASFATNPREDSPLPSPLNREAAKTSSFPSSFHSSPPPYISVLSSTAPSTNRMYSIGAESVNHEGRITRSEFSQHGDHPDNSMVAPEPVKIEMAHSGGVK